MNIALSVRTSKRIVPFCATLLVLLHAVGAQDGTLIGTLSEQDYDVSGTVYALDIRTLRIDDFTYNGKAPATVFWVNVEPSPSASGREIALKDDCTSPGNIRAYDRETVTLELPPNITLSDVRYFSVWCKAASALLGGIEIPLSLAAQLPQADAKCVDGDASDMDVAFPVQEGWNCDVLTPRFQVRWRIVKEDLDVELVARLSDNQYMGFGPSGSDSRTKMVGSDVVIAYRAENQSFLAVDYHLEGQRQCSEGKGVCRDTDLAENTGGNSISNVVGNSSEDMVRISYRRPLRAVDTVDRPIVTDRESYVSWAIGPLEGDTPLIHETKGLDYPREPVMIEFGRATDNSCPQALGAVEEDEDIPGFVRPTLSNVTEITARIGPSGGKRGVRAITERAAWGIAWYLSPTGTAGEDVLIPAVAVERGKTYIFTVYGGTENDTALNSHPLYITNSSVGGFASLSPKERAQEMPGVYAGIDVEGVERDEEGGIQNFTATAQGSQCRFSTSAERTDDIATWDDFYKTLDTSCIQNDTISNNGGTLSWTVPPEAPDILYYQCVTHKLLGFKLVVFDRDQVDQARLARENGGGPLNLGGAPDSQCKVEFDGAKETFQDCNKNFGGGLEIYFTVKDNELETLFRAKRPEGGYVGFGWGYTKMVGSQVMIAYQAQDGSATIDNYNITAQDTEGVQPANASVTEARAEYKDGYITGRFKRTLNATGLPELFINETDVIWALGNQPSAANSLQQHSKGGRGVGTVNLANAEDSSSRSRFAPVFTAHGALMSVAWFFFAPYAILAMRFFKRFKPFNLHRGLNSAVVLLTTIGFFLVATQASHTQRAHRGLGYTIFITSVLQALGGAMRPGKEASARKVWYAGHAIVGSGVTVLAFVNGMIGLDILDGGAAWLAVSVVAFASACVLYAVFSTMPKRFPVSERKALVGGGDGEGLNERSAVADELLAGPAPDF